MVNFVKTGVYYIHPGSILLFLKNTKKFAWIYWKKLLLQALATLSVLINKMSFCIGLVLNNSFLKNEYLKNM